MATDPQTSQRQAAAPAQHEPAPHQPGQRPPGQDPAGGGRAPLPHHRVRRTRISGTWVALACFAVMLLLLLVFILQNSRTVEISYFGAHGHLPLGVALLFAAVCGVLLAAAAGTARIAQLRATARRHRAADAEHLARAQQAPAAQPPGARSNSGTA